MPLGTLAEADLTGVPFATAAGEIILSEELFFAGSSDVGMALEIVRWAGRVGAAAILCYDNVCSSSQLFRAPKPPKGRCVNESKTKNVMMWQSTIGVDLVRGKAHPS